MKLGLMALFKNEGHILYEFINHYILEGIDEFVLIDDNSNDNYYENNKDWIDPLVKSNIITIKKPECKKKESQSGKYNEQLDYLQKFDWLIVCDMDEFIFGVSKDSTIKSVIEKRFLNYNMIKLWWKMFTHNSYFQPNSIINDNVITHSLNRDPKAPTGGKKYIVKPKIVKSFGVHDCSLIEEKVKQLESCHDNLIQMNHYRTQSEELLRGVKEIRGCLGGGDHVYKYRKWTKHKGETYNKKCTLLQDKRKDLINKCLNRKLIRPKIYQDSSFIKNQKVIKLNINCGLCNRLRTIFYHINNLEENENLVVIWRWNNQDPSGNFCDYFEPIENVYFINEDYKYPIFYEGNGYGLDLKNNNYEKLKLKSHILEIVENEMMKLKNNYIALHVRRSDICSVYAVFKEKYNKSYDEYDNFIESSKINNLYVATDNEETYLYFNNKYKNSHLINDNVTFLQNDTRRKTTLQDSIIDLFMCINSNKFLGTKLSSFTEVIERNIELKKISDQVKKKEE
jgi:hypothetical protein